MIIGAVTRGTFTVVNCYFTTKLYLVVWPTFPEVNFHGASKRSHEAPMTFSVVSCNGVRMPKVEEPITILRLTGTRNHKVSSHLSFAPNDNLVRAGMNNCGFETVDMAAFRAMLHLFTKPAILTAAKTKVIFILIRNSIMHGDLYDGVLFNRRY